MTSEAPIDTVLVVDDNEANRALARETLADEGYRIIEASGGEEGIAAFERETPTCVLLDVRMPGVDGIAACARIRALPNGADVPVIFLTAQRDVDTFDRALASGGDDFLTKPVRPSELVARVRACVAFRRMHREVAEQVALVRRQRDDMMRLQLQKERLTAFIVHDLKNPVNAMDLGAQLILRDKQLPAALKPIAEKLRFEARQLTRMIVNLLDLSKADEGGLAPRRVRVDLAKVIGAVVTELEWTASARQITLTPLIEVAEAIVDEDMLARMLANLVENAIRHAPPASAIDVGAREVEGELEIRVRDRGPGVAEAMRDRVFDPFVQVEGAPSSRSGRGLGLAFCKQVAASHGGRIWVEDASPGAAFCARLGPIRGADPA
ncbi:MAG: hybrid sensor histidine kinase/response regulator [Polyangiaceae bacterium]